MKLIKPKGCKDYLPPEARRLREIEKKLSSLFESWGYEEVIPPSFEYYEFLTEGLGRDYKKSVYKLIDREGEILSLRPELTKPTGRIALTHLSREPYPIKVYYRGMVFSREEPMEFPQIGVEVFGDSSICADIEVLNIAIESMKAIGIEKPIVDLNHANLINEILNSLTEDEEYRELLIASLASKNLVLYRELIAFMNIPEDQRRFLAKLPLIRGKKEILEKIHIPFDSPAVENALSELREITENIEFEEAIIDLGMVRKFDYYTGIIFELSNPLEGKVFGGGGRYDRLFGIPAVGFALSLRTLPSPIEDGKIDLLIKITEIRRDLKEALRIAKAVRDRGFKVLVIPPNADEQLFLKRKRPNIFLKLEGEDIDESKLIDSLTDGKASKENNRAF